MFHIPATTHPGTMTERVQYGYWPEGHPRTPYWGRLDSWVILCTVLGAVGPFSAERTITTTRWVPDPADAGEKNPFLPPKPVDGKHSFQGPADIGDNSRCKFCGAYGGSVEAERPCEGEYKESGKMRSWAAREWERVKRAADIRTQGWTPFGTHVDVVLPPGRKLEFSEELDDGGNPRWERIVNA